ncbi:hypothetical protein ES705_41009 [subsurface metagenome]
MKYANEALKVAEEKIEYLRVPQYKRPDILKIIKTYFQKDKRVVSAWIFGSFARKEEIYNSDIDIMIKMDEKKSYSLFDLADIQYNLENLIKRKVDIVEKGYIKPFAWDSVKNDLQLIYGKI